MTPGAVPAPAGGLCTLTAAEAARAVANGDASSEEIVAACLRRIGETDGEIGAWSFVDPDLALAQARAKDAAAPPYGPLHGVPVGVKDVLDTCDMPTEYGSTAFGGHRPAADSRCVATLRKAGAVVLGKTVTTELASPVPAGVRNPHDTSRSPGVSSSGSAAAVAASAAPLANGTQTGGSVILPAAFCGVVGYKASLDGLDRGGIRGLKPSLDTLGFFARSVEDVALVHGAVTGAAAPEDDAPAPVGLCRTDRWEEAEPAARAAVEDAAACLEAAGWDVAEAVLPPEFEGIEDAFRTISRHEGGRALEGEFAAAAGSANAWLRETARSSWTRGEIAAAHARAAAARAALGAVFDRFPILLTPPAAGEAPADLENPPVSVFNRVWTLMHGPAISLPFGAGPRGMPLGVQLVARPGDDATLIARARRIRDALDAARPAVASRGGPSIFGNPRDRRRRRP